MKKRTKVVIAAAAAALPLALVAPGHPSKHQKAPFVGRNFAHRGLHSRDKSVPENSLEAFRLAANEGYGVELDVQLTKDGQVVVFHDDTLDRVCGVSSRVDEKSYAELRQLRLCGSEQSIPLFSEVLETINGRGPIIVELKNGRRNKELCQKTYELLRHYKGDVCIESFNPLIVAWFRFHAKNMLRGQLATTKDDYGRMPEVQSYILSRTFLNFLARPHFIAYKIGPRPLSVHLSELMGAIKIGWTSHEPRNEKGRDAVIFEYYKPKLQYK